MTGMPTTPIGSKNILNKGYRVTIIAKQHLQTCLQPIFAQSDKQFTYHDVLHSACIAVKRSRNKRAVKKMKHSWIVQRGVCNPSFDLTMLGWHGDSKSILCTKLYYRAILLYLYIFTNSLIVLLLLTYHHCYLSLFCFLLIVIVLFRRERRQLSLVPSLLYTACPVDAIVEKVSQRSTQGSQKKISVDCGNRPTPM